MSTNIFLERTVHIAKATASNIQGRDIMGSGSSREDYYYRTSRYNGPVMPHTYPRPDDRDDYDTCCGCGPWYGGSTYREGRREWLPGYGSPPENRFGPGGYAGEYYQPGTASEIASNQMCAEPFRPDVGRRVLPPGMTGAALLPVAPLPPMVEGGPSTLVSQIQPGGVLPPPPVAGFRM